MVTLNEDMKKTLSETPIWVLATTDSSGTPNAVPIFYTDITEDGRLMLVDNYMRKTVMNIGFNPKVSVSVWNQKTGYQFKGNASIETSGELFESGKKMVKDKTPKGVILVDVESVYSTSPGAVAGEQLL